MRFLQWFSTFNQNIICGANTCANHNSLPLLTRVYLLHRSFLQRLPNFFFPYYVFSNTFMKSWSHSSLLFTASTPLSHVNIAHRNTSWSYPIPSQNHNQLVLVFHSTCNEHQLWLPAPVRTWVFLANRCTSPLHCVTRYIHSCKYSPKSRQK